MHTSSEQDRLLNEAARVLATLFSKSDDVIRVGSIEVVQQNQIVQKVIVVFAKQIAVEVFTAQCGMRMSAHENPFDAATRRIILDWLDTDDMLSWIAANLGAFRIRQTTDGKPIHAEHWADQMLSIEAIIVPGCGMSINETFLQFARSSKDPVNATLSSIYLAAHEGRDGKNTTTIAGPRKGITFFNPLRADFENNPPHSV